MNSDLREKSGVTLKSSQSDNNHQYVIKHINISGVTLSCDTDTQVPQQHGTEQQTGHGVDAVVGTTDTTSHTGLMLQTMGPPLTCHQLPLLNSTMDHLWHFWQLWQCYIVWHRSTVSCNLHVTLTDHFTHVPTLSVLWFRLSLYDSVNLQPYTWRTESF